MSNDFDFVTAVYRKATDPDYVDNIYVEALPKIFSRRELAQILMCVPMPTDAERNGSVEYRLSRLGSLSTLCIPLSRVIDFAQAVQRLLILGYRLRKPFTAADRENRGRLYKAQQEGIAQLAGNHHQAAQLSMALFGNPGSGKTFIMRQIANLFPPVIFHEESGRWQIPFLFLEMPHDGKSMYTLASQIFRAIEMRMPGSEYVRHYTDNVKLNAERLLLKALNIAYELGVGMIVIDEAQNTKRTGNDTFYESDSKKAGKKAEESGLMKLLITASNIGRMPLLFTGTMELMPTALTRGSPARRMVGKGSAAWRPLQRERANGMPISEFDLFMNTLFRCQWLPHPSKYHQDWSDVFYAYTQGVPDYMVKLFESAQAIAIQTQSDRLRIEHVTRAFETEFEAGIPTLEALQNPDDIMKLLMPDMFGYQPLGEQGMAQMPKAPRQASSTKEPMTMHDIVAAVTKKQAAAAAREKKSKPDASPRPMEVDAEAILGSDLRKSEVVAASPLDDAP